MITIRDIAKIAGVNHSTVSRSLNDSPEISEETKKRIKQLAKELGFEFNNSARSLSTKRTDTIGVIFAEGFDEVNAGFFFTALLTNIRRNLEMKSLDVIIDFKKNPFTGESNLEKLVNKRKIDGLLIADSKIEAGDIDFITEHKVPAVHIHFKPHTINADKADYVITDHRKGGFLATEHLIKLGHKKIITFTHFDSGAQFYEFEERTAGYKEALEKYGIKSEPDDIIRGEISFQEACSKIKSLKGKLEEATAIFAQTDLVALGIIKGLQDMGYKVPNDISVVGYDDVEFGSYLEPHLTTIHQPVEELSMAATDRLFEKLKNKANEEPMQSIKSPKLIIRASSGPVKK